MKEKVPKQPIIIKESNRERIEKALKEVQGKSRARIIDGYDDLVDIVDEAKASLPGAWANKHKNSISGTVCHYIVNGGVDYSNSKYPAPDRSCCDLRFRDDGQAELIGIDRYGIMFGKRIAWTIPWQAVWRLLDAYHIKIMKEEPAEEKNE